MFFLTENERQALVVVVMVVLIGTTLQYMIKINPMLFDLINTIESPRLYPKINVNTASYDTLVGVPFIGPATANSIIQRREMEGPFDSIDQLKHLRSVRPSNFEQFQHYLYIP